MNRKAIHEFLKDKPQEKELLIDIAKNNTSFVEAVKEIYCTHVLPIRENSSLRGLYYFVLEQRQNLNTDK